MHLYALCINVEVLNTMISRELDMDYEELLAKYQALLIENNDLKNQNEIWYGSINILSYGNAEESVMRLESSNIATELLKIIDRQYV